MSKLQINLIEHKRPTRTLDKTIKTDAKRIKNCTESIQKNHDKNKNKSFTLRVSS